MISLLIFESLETFFKVFYLGEDFEEKSTPGE